MRMLIPLTVLLHAIAVPLPHAPYQAPPQAREASRPMPRVAEIANLEFHSDVLINLHHTLYAAAWAQRPASGNRRGLAGKLPSPLDAPFTDDERKTWTSAVEYYDKQLADRDLLRDDRMEAVKLALARGDLASDAVGPELRAVLDGVLPIYTRRVWPAHDRANRDWIAATVARLRDVASDVTPAIEKLYGVKWFTAPIRIDAVWVSNWAGAYTSLGPTHAVIASTAKDKAGWDDVETVFHEATHATINPIRARIARALGDRLEANSDLWHAVQFYLTGVAVQQVLKARGIEYVPSVYAIGLFDRGWSRYRKPIETNWQPYVAGTTTLDQAIDGTVKMLATPAP